MDFNEKVILITGASSGIGADAAHHLAKLGARVSIVGRNEERLDEVVVRIINSGASKPLAIVADVTQDAERIVRTTIKRFQKLDVLINNAGTWTCDDVTSIDFCKFDQVFDVNVRSVVALTKLCVPYLEKTKGNIVNVSSIAGLKAMQNMLSYCISKVTLDHFTKCCALDLAMKGIRVNAINPATIRTPAFERGQINADEVRKMMEFGKKMFPIGRVGEVSDTSAAIAFLANDQTTFNGILLPVDGGFMISGGTESINDYYERLKNV